MGVYFSTENVILSEASLDWKLQQHQADFCCSLRAKEKALLMNTLPLMGLLWLPYTQAVIAEIVSYPENFGTAIWRDIVKLKVELKKKKQKKKPKQNSPSNPPIMMCIMFKCWSGMVTQILLLHRLRQEDQLYWYQMPSFLLNI